MEETTIRTFQIYIKKKIAEIVLDFVKIYKLNWTFVFMVTTEDKIEIGLISNYGVCY